MDLEIANLHVLYNISQINKVFLKIQTGNNAVNYPLLFTIKNDMS